MAIKRTHYEVAYLNDGDVAEIDIEVWAVDEMRAELEARRSGLKGIVADADTKEVSDLGDVRNRQALEIWAALTRLGLYKGKAIEFRREHCIGIEKVREEPVDPTPSEATTASD